ncbi:MAG: hypothetical protein RMK30_08075 [Anaerolineae bacterium]|nr:hypothetical protein [Anaerolineae bacterium]MDW8102818.1 hypothetical protein [Anaerolineae bacterium]
MKRLALSAALILNLVGCFLASSPPEKAYPALTPTPTPQPLELVVLHTNDTWGYVLPCG